MAQRIKGQEISLMLVVGGQAQSTLTAIRSFEVTPKLEKKQEGYLGETTDRYDEVFQGCDFRMEYHYEDDAGLKLIEAIIERAARRTPGVQVNIKATLNFPSGRRKLVILQDAFFGNLPFGFSSRTEYGTLSVDGSCSNVKFA